MIIDLSLGRFELDESILAEYRGRPVEWGFGALSELTYARTYSRKLEDGSQEQWWQTCQRVVEGTFTILRNHCLSLHLPWDDEEAQIKAADMMRRMFTFKFLPPGRGLWMMGTDFVYTRSGAPLNNCFSGTTEFITNHGVVRFEDVVGEELEVFAADGQYRSAKVRSFGEQELFEVTFRPFGMRSNVRTTVEVTRDHTWILRDGTRTQELQVGDVVHAHARPGDDDEDLEAFAHGLIFGDGTRHTYYPERHIIKLCTPNAAQLAEKLSQVPGYMSTTTDAEGRPVVTIKRAENWKALPEQGASPRYITSFLRGWIEADAWTKPSGSYCLDMSNAEAAQWLIKHAPVAGFVVVGHGVDERPTNFGARTEPLQRLTLAQGPVPFVVDEIKATGRVEEVYCVTEPATSSFTLAGGLQTGNCAFRSTQHIDVDYGAPFSWTFEMLMLGVGVGFDTRGKGKVNIVRPKRAPEPFLIKDSRQGWCEALEVLLNAYTGEGELPVKWDVSQIRPKGAPIKSFGGVASGPEPLVQMLARLEKLYDEYIGQEVDSALIVDTMNIIGACVVSGGVRRSAQIAFSEAGDEQFMDLKLDKEKLFAWRWASNNSLFSELGMDYSLPAQRTAENGEPGYAWLDNMRAYGRMVDPPDWRDERVMGGNPCVTADTIVMTSKGPRRVSTLIDTPFEAFVDNASHACRTGFFATGTKPVYDLVTEEGMRLRVTENHQILHVPKLTAKKRYETWVEAKDLTPGDMIVVNNARELPEWEGMGTFEQGWLLGSMLGGGHIHFSDGEGTCKLQYWGASKEEMLSLALERIETLGGDPRYHAMRTGTEVADRDMVSTGSRKLYALMREFGIDDDKNIVSDALLLSSAAFHRGFLRGLFDADGSVQGTQGKGVSVRLRAKRKQHLHIAQQMLLHLGIHSKIYEDRQPEGYNTLPNGRGGTDEYWCEAVHALIISKDNLFFYDERVGFDEPAKRERLAASLDAYVRKPNRERFVARVKSLEYAGIEPVYDCTVDEIHRFSANNLVIHNCLEQSLEDGELCCLVETFPAHHDSIEDYEATLKMAYMYAKAVTLVPTHDRLTNAIVLRNRRIGCSMSGIVQAIERFGYRNFIRMCDESYKFLQEVDKSYSEWLAIPRSIKTTSVKPSGCRPWYALTSTSEGLLTLEDMFWDHPEGQQWHEAPSGLMAYQGEGNTSRITKTYDNGEAMVYRATLSYGLRLESTGNHQWEVVGEMLKHPRRRKDGSFSRELLFDEPVWKRMDELSIGDIVHVRPGAYERERHSELNRCDSRALSMRADAHRIEQPMAMDEELAWWLGFMWGDGAMCPSKYRIRFSSGDLDQLEKVQRITQSHFGLDVEIVETSGARECWEVCIASKHLWHWLIKNDVWKYQAEDIGLIPRAIRTSSRDDVLAFISGLIDADGCAHVLNKKKDRRGKFTISTASEAFAQHLQDVCWAVGLLIGCSHNTQGQNHQERKSIYLLTSASTQDPQIWEVLQRNSLKLSALAEEPDFEGWQWESASRGYVLGRVTGVEEVGVMPTFDIEVEDTHWYYAGAAKSHNTVSLLAGATPGVHFAHSEYYIRRVRISDTSPLVEACREAGYNVEPDQYSDATVVIEFPIKSRFFSRGKDDVGIWEKVDLAAAMQRWWADNQVSCTVDFKPEEAPEIERVLERYEDKLKGISFLPASDHGYAQAPYETITKERYEEMTANLSKIKLHDAEHEVTERFCDGESCEI